MNSAFEVLENFVMENVFEVLETFVNSDILYRIVNTREASAFSQLKVKL